MPYLGLKINVAEFSGILLSVNVSDNIGELKIFASIVSF
jgi:hypothetical protein